MIQQTFLLTVILTFKLDKITHNRRRKGTELQKRFSIGYSKRKRAIPYVCLQRGENLVISNYRQQK